MPTLLDLYCCQGGAAEGYRQAGFTVTGVDIEPQPRYPFTFIRADAIEYALAHGHEYDAIHASPPCQAFSALNNIWGYTHHPNLVKPTRLALRQVGKPYVIENVVGAPLHSPLVWEDVTSLIRLCGLMFGLRMYRHRLFESNMRLREPKHLPHVARTNRFGRRIQPDEFMTTVGYSEDMPLACEIMQMPWADRHGIRQAIPPHYTKYIGEQLLRA